MKPHTQNALIGSLASTVLYIIFISVIPAGSFGFLGSVAMIISLFVVFNVAGIYAFVENELVVDSVSRRQTRGSNPDTTNTANTARSASNRGESSNTQSSPNENTTNSVNSSIRTSDDTSSSVNQPTPGEETTQSANSPQSTSKKAGSTTEEPDADDNTTGSERSTARTPDGGSTTNTKTRSEKTRRQSTPSTEQSSGREAPVHGQTNTDKDSLKGQTKVNASIALVTSVALYFIPVINTIGPLIGGFLGGYLQREGVVGGIKVGGLKGIIMILPALPLSLLVGALLNDIPVLGALAAGGTVVLAAVIVSHSLSFGIAGGICAGIALYIVDSARSGDRGSSVRQSNNIRDENTVDNTQPATTADGVRGGGNRESSPRGDERQLR